MRNVTSIEKRKLPHTDEYIKHIVGVINRHKHVHARRLLTNEIQQVHINC